MLPAIATVPLGHCSKVRLGSVPIQAFLLIPLCYFVTSPASDIVISGLKDHNPSTNSNFSSYVFSNETCNRSFLGCLE